MERNRGRALVDSYKKYAFKIQLHAWLSSVHLTVDSYRKQCLQNLRAWLIIPLVSWTSSVFIIFFWRGSVLSDNCSFFLGYFKYWNVNRKGNVVRIMIPSTLNRMLDYRPCFWRKIFMKNNLFKIQWHSWLSFALLKVDFSEKDAFKIQ